MPEYWGSFRKAFARGRRSVPISGWKWFEILDQTTASLKQQINFQE
jgi:hypothetical protein